MKSIFSHLFIPSLLLSLASCSDMDEPDIIVNPDQDSYLARLTQVEYNPAPGQFINEMPAATPTATREYINDVVLNKLNEANLISLGALGGSVTMYLATPIYNSPTQHGDFVVLGNAYITQPGTVSYGSAEPGIVYVMDDVNGNGLPDDTWYPLKGEDWKKVHEVTITYTVPEHPMADRWVDWRLNDGTHGNLMCNMSYHNHSFFPFWEKTDTLTFTALILPANGSYDVYSQRYTQVCLRGYADSYPNSSDFSILSLDDAVDENGNSVTVAKADFVKVVSAIIQNNGPMGECSTEVGGIKVLHR